MKRQNTTDILTIASMIKKRIWIIIVVPILFTVLSFALSCYILTPVYETRASIIIGKDIGSSAEGVDYSDILMYQQIVKTFGEIVKSRYILEKAAEKIGMNIRPESLERELTVEPQPDTQIMYLEVESKDPDSAVYIANTISEIFVEEAEELLPLARVRILDRALKPAELVSPKKTLNIVIGFISGIIASVGIIVLIEYMDNTIKEEVDLKKYTDLPVIGVIIKDA